MGKPAFDPSLPFETTQSAKPAFDPSAPFEATTEPEDLGFVENVARKAGTISDAGFQALSLGHKDEANAAIDTGLQAGGELLSGRLPRFREVLNNYRNNVGKERAQIAASEKENPSLATAANLATSLALPIPGAAMKTLGRAIATGVGLGAGSASGSSDADLTKLIDGAPGEGLAELGKYAGDVGIGGVAGGVAGGLGRGLGWLGEKASDKVKLLNEWAKRKADKAGQEIKDLALDKVLTPERQKAGQLGGEAQKGYRDTKDVLDAQDRGRLAPDKMARVAAIKAELGELADDMIGAKLDDIPGQKAAIDALRAEYQALLASRPERLAAAEAEIGSLKNQVLPRLKRYGPVLAGYALPGALGTAGAVGGAALGGEWGAGLGALAGAGSRPAIQATMRMANSPAFRKAASELLARATKGGKVSAALGTAVQKAPAAVSRTEAALPEFLQPTKLRQLVEQMAADLGITTEEAEQMLSQR